MLLDSSQSWATLLRRKNQKRIRQFLRKKNEKFPTSGEPAQQEASGVGREEVNRSPLYTKQSIF